jgi:hypothetical protein
VGGPGSGLLAGLGASDGLLLRDRRGHHRRLWRHRGFCCAGAHCGWTEAAPAARHERRAAFALRSSGVMCKNGEKTFHSGPL